MFDLEQYCINHPERETLEKCEVCGDPLCGYCLYYTEDGQRLCEKHAQLARQNGLQIYPPAAYADGIIPAQASAKRKEDNDDDLLTPQGVLAPKKNNNPILYRGNNTDLNGFLAMLFGVISILSCCGAIYCLPFAAVLLAIFAYINAKDAVDPSRTRQQAIIALLTGGVVTMVAVACIGFYVWIFAISANASSSFNFNTTPFIFPTSTSTFVPSATPAREQTSTPRPGASDVQYEDINPWWGQDVRYQVVPDRTPSGRCARSDGC